jgi:hypothetical protein
VQDAYIRNNYFTLAGMSPELYTGFAYGNEKMTLIQFNLACTRTIGYWKTHGPGATGNNSNEWPVTSLTLGTLTYTDTQLKAILNTAVKGNGLISLAHQLIGAKLNIAHGATTPQAVLNAIVAADALIGSKVVPTDYLSPSVTSTYVNMLTMYNEGKLPGTAHCD